MALLSDADINAAVAALDGWKHRDKALRRSITFPSFLGGVEAVRSVAEAAERADHHPDIDIRWRTVTFTLSTHSEGGITEKDVALAKEIDRLLSTPG